MRHHHFQKTWKPFLHPGDESLNCNSKPWVLTCQKRPQRNEPCRPLCCRELSPLPVLSTAWSGGSIKSTRKPNSDLCAEQELRYWLLTTLCLPGLLSVHSSENWLRAALFEPPVAGFLLNGRNQSILREGKIVCLWKQRVKEEKGKSYMTKGPWNFQPASKFCIPSSSLSSMCDSTISKRTAAELLTEL